MLQVLGVVAIAGVVLTLLDRETQKQHDHFQHLEAKLRRETAMQREKIRHAMQASTDYANYKQYVEMHYASVKTANEAFKLYSSAKHVIGQLKQQLILSGEQIMLLKQQRTELQGLEREQVHQNLKQLYEVHHEIKNNLLAYRNQKEIYYQEIKKLNEATADLKQYIRHNTGNAGQLWYSRLQQRRLGA